MMLSSLSITFNEAAIGQFHTPLHTHTHTLGPLLRPLIYAISTTTHDI